MTRLNFAATWTLLAASGAMYAKHSPLTAAAQLAQIPPNMLVELKLDGTGGIVKIRGRVGPLNTTGFQLRLQSPEGLSLRQIGYEEIRSVRVVEKVGIRRTGGWIGLGILAGYGGLLGLFVLAHFLVP